MRALRKVFGSEDSGLRGILVSRSRASANATKALITCELAMAKETGPACEGCGPCANWERGTERSSNCEAIIVAEIAHSGHNRARSGHQDRFRHAASGQSP